MKKTIMIMGGLVLSLLSFSVHAQTPTPEKEQTPVAEKPIISTWDAKKNPTVDSITAPYQAKILSSRPALTTADIFPAIGAYESSTNVDASNVTIMLDEQSKGIVWVEGLPQGKIKAMLMRSPATYKIPAQKNDEGKNVAEGTLVFDKETNTLNICIGKSYNVENPSEVFAAPAEEPTPADTKKTKPKKATGPKAWVYTGTKVVKETAMQ
jgi:hypothetical protein